MSDFDNDNKLKAFLKSNYPAPPPARRDELDRIMERLDLKEKSRSWFGSWAGGLSALAAGIAAFVFVTQSNVVPRAANNELVVQSAFEELSEDLNELSAYEEDTEAIGEEYLAFVTD